MTDDDRGENAGIWREYRRSARIHAVLGVYGAGIAVSVIASSTWLELAAFPIVGTMILLSVPSFRHHWRSVAVLALGAGLLSSVLTPCLLQLVVVFGGVIAGFSTVPGQAAGGAAQLTPVIRRKIIQLAFAFVLGFILLYALAGAFIGAVGHQAQLAFSEYSRLGARANFILNCPRRLTHEL